MTKYPIYIISKGRWEYKLRLTARALQEIGAPFRIVVEPVDYDEYAKVIPPEQILTLPFSNLGQGSIPARNWVWEHSLSEGHRRHWILDDNIRSFGRRYQGHKVKVLTDATFRAIEDFTDRYENIRLSGMQYGMFVPSTYSQKPLIWNTRIYSCILIDNSLPLRWRGRYNEDTDLSLRVLKSGECTVLFNAFYANKNATMRMKGGNTDQLYQGDGRLRMALSLQEQHPDCVQVKRRWGRWQHVVDYSRFRYNRPRLRPDFVMPTEPNEYGMVFVDKVAAV